jgi:pimeloyl-ACP methyl ester carboxylesterase
MIGLILAGAAGATMAVGGGVMLHRNVRQRRIARALRLRSGGGIAEASFVPIGGIEQWVGIRGEDRNNPVLMVIHGGPGSSYSIFTPVMRRWEEHFTIVQWDQPGTGRTFGRHGRDGTGELTFERLIRDGIELAERVHERLPDSNVVLLASSLGSLVGLAMVQRRPDLFAAYVGADQNVGMVHGREEAHEAALGRLRAAGLRKGGAALERIGSDPRRWTAKDFTTVAKWTMRSDPRMYGSIMKLLKTSVWYSPAHTLRDLRDFVSGMDYSIERLVGEIAVSDAWRQGTRYELPFFIFQGENDVLTPASLAEAYLADVVAPVKDMVTIPDAGHFAAFVQPEQFLSELLVRVRPLAVPSRRKSANLRYNLAVFESARKEALDGNHE